MSTHYYLGRNTCSQFDDLPGWGLGGMFEIIIIPSIIALRSCTRNKVIGLSLSLLSLSTESWDISRFTGPSEL